MKSLQVMLFVFSVGFAWSAEPDKETIRREDERVERETGDKLPPPRDVVVADPKPDEKQTKQTSEDPEKKKEG